MVLVRFQFGINRSVVVQNLKFVSQICSISSQRGPDSQSVICARGEFKLEPEDEIGILLFRIEIATSFGGPDYNFTFFHSIAMVLAGPV